MSTTVTFIPRTRSIGWVRVTGEMPARVAIQVAARYAPPRWRTDTAAEWSEDYDAWLVPVYLPTR